MKASILAAACLIAASPAFAFSHGPGGAFHGHGGHHGGHVLTPGMLLNGEGGAPYVAPESEEAPPPPEPVVILAPPAAQACAPAPVAAPSRPAGPHIIYIGEKPQIHGPRVIYGTN